MITYIFYFLRYILLNIFEKSWKTYPAPRFIKKYFYQIRITTIYEFIKYQSYLFYFLKTKDL